MNYSLLINSTNCGGLPDCYLYIGNVEVVSKPDRPGVISCQGLIGLRVSSAETAHICLTGARISVPGIAGVTRRQSERCSTSCCS